MNQTEVHGTVSRNEEYESIRLNGFSKVDSKIQYKIDMQKNQL